MEEGFLLSLSLSEIIEAVRIERGVKSSQRRGKEKTGKMGVEKVIQSGFHKVTFLFHSLLATKSIRKREREREMKAEKREGAILGCPDKISSCPTHRVKSPFLTIVFSMVLRPPPKESEMEPQGEDHCSHPPTYPLRSLFRSPYVLSTFNHQPIHCHFSLNLLPNIVIIHCVSRKREKKEGVR